MSDHYSNLIFTKKYGKSLINWRIIGFHKFVEEYDQERNVIFGECKRCGWKTIKTNHLTQTVALLRQEDSITQQEYELLRIQHQKQLLEDEAMFRKQIKQAEALHEAEKKLCAEMAAEVGTEQKKLN